MRLPFPFFSLRFSRLRPVTATGIVLLCLTLALPSFGSAAPAAKPSTSSSQSTGQTAGQTAAAGKPTQNSGPSTDKPTTQPPQQAAESVPPQTAQSANPADAPVAPPLPEPHSQTAPQTTTSTTSATGAANTVSAALPAGPALIARPGGMPLPPFLQKLLDPKGSLTISDIIGAGQTFQPFENASASLFGELRQTPGTVWLRFTMAPSRLPSTDGENNDGLELALLDLGDQIPASPQVWTRPGGKGTPREIKPGESGLYPLTSLSGGGEVLVRLTGQPGLWFAPSLRSLSDALGAPDRRLHPLTLAALTVLLMLCVVRSITERGDGRIWAAIFAGAALVQAFWGVPATPDGSVRPMDMPGLFAAGVALMLLPHVGRNIMRTREISPATDVLLLILALPGAALALLPLLPGQAWMARLLALWPLGAALPLLPALYLLARGIPGSGLFSLACLAMTGGSLASLWGINEVYAPLLGQGPLLGVTLATLLLAAAPRSAYGEARLPRPREEIIPLGNPLNIGLSIGPEPASLPTREGLGSALKLEEALRSPLDALLREACALDQVLGGSQEAGRNSLSMTKPFAPSLADKLPPPPLNERDARQARRHADNLVAASRELSALVTDIPRTAMRAGRQTGGRRIFELRRLVTDSFDTVREEAETRGLGLSWYVAPHLGNLYRGDSDRLRFILSMLLADAVRATERGVVSLRVRRGDMSTNPGHLQFTVADTGEGTPPLRRSSLLVARAWELAADHRGELFVDGTPYGVDITFSMDCTALTDDGTGELPRPPENIERGANPVPNPRLVILASDIPLNRQILAWHLEGQGQEVWEARDTEEAIALYAHAPASLVIFDGHLPEDGVVTAIAGIRVFEGEHLLPAVPFLVLAVDEEQAERLHQAGCDHSLPLPVVRGEFRAMALQLASPGGRKSQPSLAPRRVPFLAAHPSPVKNERLADRVLQVQPPQSPDLISASNAQASKQKVAPLDFAPARPLTSGAVGTPQPVDKKAEQPTPAAPKPATTALTTAGPTDEAKPSASIARPSAAAMLETRLSTSPTQDKPTAPTHKADPTPSIASIAEVTAAPVTSEFAPQINAERPSAETPVLAHAEASAGTPARPMGAAPSLLDVPARKAVPAKTVAHEQNDSEHPTFKSGLNIPESPPKKRGWLTSLFKPAPYVAPTPADEPTPRGGEWVGEPVPITSPTSRLVSDSEPIQKTPSFPLEQKSASDQADAPDVASVFAVAEDNQPKDDVSEPSLPEGDPKSPLNVIEAGFSAADKNKADEDSEGKKFIDTESNTRPTPAPVSLSLDVTESDMPPVTDLAHGNAKNSESDNAEADLAPLDAKESANLVPSSLSENFNASVAPDRSTPLDATLTPEALAKTLAETQPQALAEVSSEVPPAVPADANAAIAEAVTDASSEVHTAPLAAPRSADFADIIPAAPLVLAEPLLETPAPANLESPVENTAAEAPTESSIMDFVKAPGEILAEASSKEQVDTPTMVLANLSAAPLENRQGEFTSPGAEKVQDDGQASLLPTQQPTPPQQQERQPVLKPVLEQNEPDSSSSEQTARSNSKNRRRKSRLEELPFLSLDPNYMPPGSEAEEDSPLSLLLDPTSHGLNLVEPSPARHVSSSASDESDEDVIVDLTEAEMVESPLLQQAPDLLISLDSALERAELALDKQDTRGLASAAGRMSDRAAAFGLHGLADLAHCLRESAENSDFETAAQLLPDLRAEVARQRGK